MPPHRHKTSMVRDAWYASHGLTKIPHATAGHDLPDEQGHPLATMMILPTWKDALQMLA